MKNKIYIFSGEVKSTNDEDIHYIPSYIVARLLGINPRHKNVVLVHSKHKPQGYQYLEGDVFLGPSYTGNYNLSPDLKARIDKILNN